MSLSAVTVNLVFFVKRALLITLSIQRGDWKCRTWDAPPVFGWLSRQF
jgi:hypothetical protein